MEVPRGVIKLVLVDAAPLRCAAEYLEMTDDFSENNLASRTDLFLLDSVLSSSLRDSIHALKSCEHLLPLADDLGIVQSCVDSIAARACSADPGSLLFSWPARYDPPHLLWNGIDTGAPRYSCSTSSSSTAAGGGSWLDDLTVLTLPFYKRVVAAMRAADPSSEALERSLVSYARRSIPGLSRSGWKHPSAPVFSEAEQRDLLETVVASLPPEKTVAGLTTASFLFTLLRNVGILRASEASRAALERRIASQLEQATVDDLLIRSYSYQADEALYDVGCVERILRYFLEGLQQRPAPNSITAAEEEEQQGGARPRAERLAHGDDGGGAGSGLRRDELPQADAEGVLRRGAEQADASAGGCDGDLIRADTSVPAGYRRHRDGGGGVEIGGGEGERDAAAGNGHHADPVAGAGDGLLEQDRED